jgi:hypothetical protein
MKTGIHPPSAPKKFVTSSPLYPVTLSSSVSESMLFASCVMTDCEAKAGLLQQTRYRSCTANLNISEGLTLKYGRQRWNAHQNHPRRPKPSLVPALRMVKDGLWCELMASRLDRPRIMSRNSIGLQRPSSRRTFSKGCDIYFGPGRLRIDQLLVMSAQKASASNGAKCFELKDPCDIITGTRVCS